MAEATGKFTAETLSEQQKQYLRNLPLKAELKQGNVRFYLCHAKPSDPLYGYSAQDSEEWISEIEGLSAEVLLVGHTHTPFIRQIGNRVLVNPGSLGQPKTGNPNACYAVWQDGSFELKSFPYHVDKTIAKLRSLSFPSAIETDLITVLQTGSV
jgi:protein phosphatase